MGSISPSLLGAGRRAPAAGYPQQPRDRRVLEKKISTDFIF